MTTAALSVAEGQQGSLVVSLSGDWLLGAELPDPEPVLDRLQRPPQPASVAFETESLGEWDTGLVKTLIAIRHSAGTPQTHYRV